MDKQEPVVYLRQRWQELNSPLMTFYFTYLTRLRVQALNANVSVLTCLANDEGYDKVFLSLSQASAVYYSGLIWQ